MAVEQTDAQLVSRCRAGEAAAWNEFVERFSRYVYAICGRGFRLPQQDAEDVFQEVFARAFERLPSFGATTRATVARSAHAAALHRPAAAAARATRLPTRTRTSKRSTTCSATLDDAMTVRAALDKVGDPCREILDRFFCRDESYHTIGDVLDIPAGTIASRISRCLEKVRAELDGRSRGSRPS